MFSPEQMAAYNTKAAMYREAGNYSDARDLLHHGLRSARDTMGEDAEVTMSMMHNYGALLAEMKKYSEAQPLLEEALERRLDILGEDNVDTVATYANLGVTLHEQGKLSEELELRRKHVAACKALQGLPPQKSSSNVEGPEYDATKSYHEAVAHLSGVLVELDQLEEAVPLIAESMEYYVKTFGVSCKAYVPQVAMHVASSLYTKLLARPNSGSDIKGGARLVAALTAVVMDRKPEGAAPPTPPTTAVEDVSDGPTASPSAAASPVAPAPASAPVASSSEIESISDLLRSVGLTQYVSTFEEEEMEISVMRDAMRRQGRAAVDEVLKELGVTSMGHRTKIANALTL